WPCWARKFEKAMLKHAACAAAISSSGFVPFSFSKRVANEKGVPLSTPLVVSISPSPPRRFPRHVPAPVRSIAAMTILDLLWLNLIRNRPGSVPDPATFSFFHYARQDREN